MSNQGRKNFAGQGPSSIMKTATKVAMYQCHQVGLTRSLEHREFDPLKGIEVVGGWEDRKEGKTKMMQRHCSHATVIL
jgi:hypothetical protein